MKSEFRILLIDNNQKDKSVTRESLSAFNKTRLAVEIVERLSDGLDAVFKDEIDLILLDLAQPEIHVFDTLKELRKRSISLPVIVLIGMDDKDIGIRAINEGAQDYLYKNNLDSDSLLRSIHYAVEYHKMTEELSIANKKILAQQKSVLEEERLKTLLEQSGSTAHDLNQPLTSLLGSIYLMKMEKDNPEKFSRYMERIENSGKRISAIVQKIQAIGNDKAMSFSGDSSVDKIYQKVTRLNVQDPENNFENLNNLFRTVQSRYNGSAA